MKFRFYKQLDSMDCGPTALRMIAKNYGKSYSLPFLREKCFIDRPGVSLKGISEAADAIGFRTVAVKVPLYPPPDAGGTLEIMTRYRPILARIYDQILNLIKNKAL